MRLFLYGAVLITLPAIIAAGYAMIWGPRMMLWAALLVLGMNSLPFIAAALLLGKNKDASDLGIDVPNATMIVIESSDQFGLSQLHQLRGRVGRGEHASFCILLSDAASGARGDADDTALTRLNALVNSTSGFELSELDFQLRGPGQFFGTRQHGLPEFRLADLTQESNLLSDAREDAQLLLKNDPTLTQPQNHPLRSEIQAQFGDALPIATVG